MLSPTVYSCVCDSIRLGTGLASLISVADLGWLLQPITAPALRLSFGRAQHYHCVKTGRLSFIGVSSVGPEARCMVWSELDWYKVDEKISNVRNTLVFVSLLSHVFRFIIVQLVRSLSHPSTSAPLLTKKGFYELNDAIVCDVTRMPCTLRGTCSSVRWCIVNRELW